MRTWKPLLLAALAGACLAGCFDSNEKRLLGTWTLDVESLKELDDFKKMSVEEQQLMLQLFGSMDMELTFTSDKLLFEAAVFGQRQSDEATYEVKSADGDRFVLSTTNSKGKTEEVTAEFKGDTLVIDMGDRKKFALKRK